MSRAPRCLALAFALALAAPPAALAAQAACTPALPRAADAWASPLDRAITLHAGTVTLRDALDRITVAARLRLSYSRELVPLDRSTCLEFSRTPVGEVLARILDGTALSAVVAGRDHVVLAATRERAAGRAGIEADAFPDVVVLDGLHVEAIARRPDGGAGTITTSIDGRALERQGAGNLADALDGVMPGVWVWSQGSSSALTQYGSLRGASSFSLTTPKLYIDGLEVANPLLVATLDPATIERVDVVRGPQGAALFGADAIAGVTHIITRQGQVDASGSRFALRTGLGSTGGAWAASRTIDQDHGLSAFTGNAARSARLDLAFSSVGDYVPAGGSQRISAVGSARSVQDRFAFSATGRFLSERSSLAESPLLQATSSPADARAIAISQYTAGFTAAFQQNERWSHTLVAGMNGYTLDGAPTIADATTATDSALAAAGSAGFRSTLRLTSAGRVPLGGGGEGVLTLSAEHSALNQDGGLGVLPFDRGGELRSRGQPMMEPAQYSPLMLSGDGGLRQRSNSGLSARFDATLRERVNLTAGARLERTTLEDGSRADALLPSLGASWRVLGGRDARVVLRAAYGKGVRWPQVPSGHAFARALELAPEVQSGTEVGVDVSLGRPLTLQLTRFDQLARGLVQQVAVQRDSTPRWPAGTVFVAQNVGAIANRGWELAASSQQGPVTLTGTLSAVDSRVRAVALGYTGDLTAGDRMLGVPATTASVSAQWNAPRWSATFSASRAFDWINYDRLALAQARADSVTITAAQLRAYWLGYDGGTRLRASFSRDLGARLTLRLTGENLLDLQTGEPDNATIVPGRTFSLSLRARL